MDDSLLAAPADRGAFDFLELYEIKKMRGIFLILGTFSAFRSFLPGFRLAILSFSCSARS
jgi:hypothetical protein